MNAHRPAVRGFLWGALLVLCTTEAQAQTELRALSVTAPAEAIAGQSLTVDLQVQVSTATAVTVSAWLYAAGPLDGGPSLGRASLALTDGTQTVQSSFAVPAGVEGQYFIAVRLDPDDTVTEANEFDNETVSADRVSVGPMRPNLAIDALTVDPSALMPGEAVTVDLTVNYDGPTPRMVDVAAYLSPDEGITTSDLLGDMTSVSISAGTATPVRLTVTVPPDWPAGDATVGAIVDPGRTMVEANPNDNAAGTSINVFTDALDFVTETLPRGTLGSPYFARLNARGGDGHPAYSVTSGTLPDGLSIDDNALVGVPTRSGEVTFEITATSRNLTATQTFTLTVVSTGLPLEVATATVQTGFLQRPFEQYLVAQGGEPPYAFIPQDNLPSGLILESDGRLAGVPATLGDTTFTVQVEDRLGAQAERVLTLSVLPALGVRLFVSDTPWVVPAGTPVDRALEASGGEPPYAWRARSILPDGLVLDEEAGRITGTPARVGRFPVWIEVTDNRPNPSRDNALVLLEVEDDGRLTLSPEVLPETVTRAQYEVILEPAGGQPPFRWRLVPGTDLPNGFFLVPGDGIEAPVNTARLYGVGLVPSVSAFTIRVEDAFDRRHERAYALIVRQTVADLSEGGCRHTAGDAGDIPVILLGLGAFLYLGRRRRRP